MANEEHLQIVMRLMGQGSAAWHEWREANPDVHLDLAGVELKNAQLQGCDLQEANLTGGHATAVRMSASSRRR